MWSARVFSSLWGSPEKSLLDTSLSIIERYLENGFKYVSLHKRGFEGYCSEHLKRISCSSSDINPLELPLNNTEWLTSSTRHPLCDMNSSFVKEILHMHNKTGKILVAHDGQVPSNIDGVFLNEIKHELHYDAHPIIDVFLSMHSDFFIMNPVSTMSYQIFIVRTALGLESVPILQQRNYLDIVNKLPFLAIIDAINLIENGK